MRSFSAMALLMLFASASAQDAYLNTAFVPRYWKAGQPYAISARVRNASGTTPLITFRVDWRYNNGPVQVGNTQSTTGIMPGQYWPYTHPVSFNQTAQQGLLKVWVVGNGDSNHANDTLYFPVDLLDVWATKSVLMEQYTGTWCQFCPIPNATTNVLDQDPLIGVAKHHNDDEWSSANSSAPSNIDKLPSSESASSMAAASRRTRCIDMSTSSFPGQLHWHAFSMSVAAAHQRSTTKRMLPWPLALRLHDQSGMLLARAIP